jgi:hypothetical protein
MSRAPKYSPSSNLSQFVIPAIAMQKLGRRFGGSDDENSDS